MNKTPLVSVIIVNYNGQKYLEDCLESLNKVTYLNAEVIFVDNGSSDDSVEFVTKHYPHVNLIRLNENKGYAEANNIGAKIANGNYLMFLNNDTVVSSDFIDRLVYTAETDNRIAICQSLLVKPDGTIDSSGDFIDELGVVYNSKTEVTDIREISCARGASMLVRKEFFEKVGGFDAKFFVSFEDVDLGWRAWIFGYRVVIVPQSRVVHYGGQTISKIKPQVAFHGFKNQLAMKITNFETSLAFKKTVLFFAVYGARELRIWFDYLIHGKTNLSATPYDNVPAQKPSIIIITKSILWILSNFRYIIQKHKYVNSNRVMSTKILKEKMIISNTRR